MLLVWNITLNKDVVVQVWQSAENVKLATQQGYQVLPSSYETDVDHCWILRFLVFRLWTWTMA